MRHRRSTIRAPLPHAPPRKGRAPTRTARRRRRRARRRASTETRRARSIIAGRRALRYGLSGGVLLSRDPAVRLPSALAGLTAGFGMGTGGTPPAPPPQ